MNIIKNLFYERAELTLNEIYLELSMHDEISTTGEKLRHRIRSAIYTLKKNGEIDRISRMTYRKRE